MNVYLEIWFWINIVVCLWLIAWRLREVKDILNYKNKTNEL